ncbi:sulfotransferase 1C2-like [Sitodiplosis mosellana]|uniref:sulfotransferase 1C2-like n=1 Tax=Sitodiplosis mosellana TaxID=263140 RepID=UPI002443F8D2|nr:sulfotransferase 1C2-like [Sitodiplosis mosellana]
MSIIFTEVENPNNCKARPFHGTAGIVRATIDPATYDQLPFPKDYKYFSCLQPRTYVDWAERIQNFKVRSDDIWVLGFPKTGSTWIQNIVYPLKNNLDSTIFSPLNNFLEIHSILDNIDGDEEFAKFIERREKLFEELDTLPSPRLMKSHLPAYLLPKEIWTVRPKLIHMSRDVKDVAVSHYHMCRNSIFLPYKGSAHEFFHSFYNDYFVWGPYHQHVQSFRQLHHLDHLLLMTYEELSANTLASVKRLSEFLGCKYSDEDLHQLIEQASFEKMQRKLTTIPGFNPDFKFCRKGKVGGYRDEMSEEDVKNFDEWTERNKKELAIE